MDAILLISEPPSSEEENRTKSLIEVEIPTVRAATSVAKNSGGGKVGKGQENDAINTVELAKKPHLTEEDVKCPICWSILYEPTTLPCKHSLCMSCYLTHAEETSLNCPCCRRRLSIWSRKAKKQNDLLDKELWNRLNNEFPDLIQARANGDDSQGLLSDDKSCSQLNVRDGVLSSAPGVIFTELQEVLKPHQDDMEKERLREEAASLNLIKQIEEDERKLLINFQEREKQDFVLAKKLHVELNVGDDPGDNVDNDKPLRRSTRERKPSQKFFHSSASIKLENTSDTSTVTRTTHKVKIDIKSSPLEKQASQKAKQFNKVMNTCNIFNDIAMDSSSNISTPNETVAATAVVKIDHEENTGISNDSCTPTTTMFDDDEPSILNNMDICQPKQNSCPPAVTDFMPAAVKQSSVLSYAAAKILQLLGPDDELIPPSDNEDEDYRSSALKQADLTVKAAENASIFDDEEDTIIDYEHVVREADAVAARYQEQADRAFAESLQRKMKWGIDEGRGKDSDEKYPLRAWKRTRTSENV